MPDRESPANSFGDWTILKILNWTQSYFEDHAIESPRLAAEILLAFTLDIKRIDLYLQYDRPLEATELADYKTVIKQRVANIPVAYITGKKGFYEAEFSVTPDVLIPRPDTETLVEKALDLMNEHPKQAQGLNVLELGTGSGAIVISLAKALPQHRYTAMDLSYKAAQVARQNARKILETPPCFFVGSWLDSVSPSAGFDLIISNPPYIRSDDIARLEPEIKNNEPVAALDGGADGLDCYREIIGRAAPYLSPGGSLMLEIGYDQRREIETIAKKEKIWHSVQFYKDLAGHDRVAEIKKSID